MNKEKMNEMQSLMKKIHEAMRISKEKQVKIEDNEKKLYEETRIMMVEKGKEELEKLKKEKEEFDKMTVSNLTFAKKQIILLKAEAEKEFQKNLIKRQRLERKNQRKKKEIFDKMKAFKERNYGNKEMLEQIETVSNKAEEKLNQEYLSNLKEIEEDIRDINKSKTQIDSWEKDIDNYSLDLNVADKVKADAENEIKKDAERKYYEDLAKKLKEQAHYEDLADELVAQAEKEKEQEQNEEGQDQNDEDEIGEQGVEQGENGEEEPDKKVVTVRNNRVFDGAYEAPAVHESAEASHEGGEVAHEDEGYDGEDYDDEGLEEEDDKKKPGFFKRLFNKIKEFIKKVVTKVKNGFKKLTTKKVEALDSAEKELEEDLEGLEGLEGELTADDIRKEVEKAAAEQEEPAEKPKEEGIRDRVKADPETIKQLNGVAEKEKHREAHEQEDDDRIWDYLPKPAENKNDDKEPDL